MAQNPNLKTIIEDRELAKLAPLKKNAHYMDKKKFALLVENIKADGCLTSLPVVYDGDIRGEILSGNHRVKAAIQAGITSAKCVVVKSKLTGDQKTGLQLSHNSIVGKDDQNILRDLYDSIADVDLKIYSGLCDDDFLIDEMELKPLSFENQKTYNVTMFFLASELDVFNENIKEIAKIAKKNDVLAADYRDFNLFFETVLKIKSKFNIINTSLAVREMTKLALDRLAQLQETE
jgi:hypothetical protein